MKTINKNITQTSAKQIRKRKFANDENEKENKCGVSPFLVKSFHQNKESLTSSINLNRIKRLRLNSISPNSVSSNRQHVSNTFLFAAAHKYEHLMISDNDENSSSSMDSGIGIASNLGASPASFEIQLINATVKSEQQQQKEKFIGNQRPRLNKQTYLQSLDDFSSSESELEEEEEEEDNYEDDFKLIKNNDEIDSKLFFENTIEIANDEETRDTFDFKFNLSMSSSTKSFCQQQQQQQQQNTSNMSSTSGNARRCLFKNSPLSNKTNLTTTNINNNNSTPKIATNECVNYLINDTNKSTKKLYRQITPISTIRHNPIIPNNGDDYYNSYDEITEQHNDSVTELTKTMPKKTIITSLMDYSLSSIENSLEIFAQKRRERATNNNNILNRINECDDDDEQQPQQPQIECQYNHDLIKTSLNEMESTCLSRRLIGDHSRYHTLPCIASIKHADLNVIEASTLTQVLDGRYSSQIDRVIVIDSRYPYEFEGGHIRSAQNVYTKEKLLDVFLSDEAKLDAEQVSTGRTIIIFHCEFSSERGPNLLRFLRNQDRAANSNVYPKLFYPEIYLLEGGYKAFYETHEDYCEPKMYKPMLHADHAQDLKHFRAKTKTWETQNKYNNAITATSYKTTTSRGKTSSRRNNLGRLQRFPKSTLF